MTPVHVRRDKFNVYADYNCKIASNCKKVRNESARISYAQGFISLRQAYCISSTAPTFCTGCTRG